MALTMFLNERNHRASLPRATIYPKGVIRFTSGAQKLFELNKYLFCILSYDEDEKKIVGVLSFREKEKGSITLSHNVWGTTLTSLRFFKYFNIVISGGISCEIEAWEKPGSFVIDLKTATATKKSHIKYAKGRKE